MTTEQFKHKRLLRSLLWTLGVVSLIFVLSRLENCKMRYVPQDFQQDLIEKGQTTAVFKQKKYQGRSLNYLEIRNDTATTVVVMVHGSPGSLSAYDVYLSDNELSQKASLVSVDRLGFGYSDFGKAEPSLEVQASMLAEVLKDFSHQKKILVGHSMGGPVIVKTAMLFPDLVDALIPIAPSVAPDLEPSITWRKIVDLPPLRWLTPPALRVCNQEIIPLKLELESMMDTWEMLTIPTIVIQGEKDALVSADNAFFMEKMLPNSPFFEIKMIKGGNHFILWSEVELVKEQILKMLTLLN